jgi:ssDNA-binding Zn-finger/Zn-ribbon topoisomerase 1
MTDGTGKPCPDCGAPMVNLASLNLRQCIGCGHSEHWNLKDGQKPLVNTNRGDKKK